MKKYFDILVVGAGVFGLSIARALSKNGLNVCLIEKNKVGAGSSGGLLGALVPGIPSSTSSLSIAQSDGLALYKMFSKNIEIETGIDIEYRRYGRIEPILSVEQRDRIESWLPAAVARWEVDGEKASIKIQDKLDSVYNFLVKSPYGYLIENMSAQVMPRMLLCGLELSFKKFGGTYLQAEVDVVDEAENVCYVNTSLGVIEASKVILANGYELFNNKKILSGHVILGKGIKGQSLLLEGELPMGSPVITKAGTYIVQHKGSYLAVGSTSEKDWSSLDADDEGEADILNKVSSLMPGAKNLKVNKRWAAIRPAGNKNRLTVGFVSKKMRVVAASGGYKIGFALAPVVSEWVTTIVNENSDHQIPQEFRPTIS